MSGTDRSQCRVDSENTMGQDHSSLRGVSCQDILHHPYLFTLETWVCLSLNVSSIIRIVSHYLINIKYCLSSYIGECSHNPSGDSLHWALFMMKYFHLWPVASHCGDDSDLTMSVTGGCADTEPPHRGRTLRSSVTSSASIGRADEMCHVIGGILMKETRPPNVPDLMVYLQNK